MNQVDRQIYIALSAVQGIGPRTLQKLTQVQRQLQLSWSEIWAGRSKTWDQLGLSSQQQAHLLDFQTRSTPSDFAAELAAKNVQVVLKEDPVYPKLLAEIPDPPALLFVKGLVEFWDQLPIAIIGTRHPSSYGEFVTRKLTTELVELGATIISGFMYGVDMLAHQAAMSADGRSVGVLGFGFDHVFPASHAPVIEEFLATGNTLITEFPPATQALKGYFPRRNRVVAGLSLAVVVTEAAIKSGTRITVQRALDYNRAVCAVPGPITNPYSEGTKYLLNEGAMLVGSGYEVLAEAEILSQLKDPALLKHSVKSSPQPAKSPPSFQNEVASQMYTHLQARPLSAEELKVLLHIELSEVTTQLTLLELAGHVFREGEMWQVVH